MVEVRTIKTNDFGAVLWKPSDECPENGGSPVPPMVCMFCPYGHLTECHYPETCDEGSCNHYGQLDEEEHHDI